MLDTNHEVDELMRKSAQGEIPAEVEQRLRLRLEQFRLKVEKRQPSRLRWLALPAVALAAVALALVLLPGGSNASRVYAAAADHLRSAQSIGYTIVLSPFTEVSFSYVAPSYRRVGCSWGVEIRTDGSGKQLVLMQWNRTYAVEQVSKGDTLANSMDLFERFKSLPRTADESLGEKRVGNRQLFGYRLHQPPPGDSIPGFKALDLWVDAATGNPDHAGILIQEPGKPLYEIQIKDIRVGEEFNRSLFDMTPPAGYTPIEIPQAAQPEIGQTEAFTAVVVSTEASYSQVNASLLSLQTHLKEMGVTPVGPPFMRYQAPTRWQTGYPVVPGTRAQPPYESISIPATLSASVVVKGPWGQDFTSCMGKDPGSRWGTFVRRILGQGYALAGPPTEIWSGEPGRPPTQATEMRIAVTKAK